MGDLHEIVGRYLRFSPFETCPDELRGATITLKSKDGDSLELPAEAATISAKVRKIALRNGIAEPMTFPLKKPIMLKVCEYLKHHKDTPTGELRTPLESDNLAECGATKWDANFVNVDKNTLFELTLAASVLDIPGLFFLTGAKAAVMTKDKSADKLRKEFNLSNDLSASEERALTGDDGGDVGVFAVVLAGVSAAADKNQITPAERQQAGVFTVDSKSWRHANWRAAVLLDWNKLSDAPKEVCADKDLMLAAVMASEGQALKYGSPELKADREVVLEAVKYHGTAMREASAALRADRAFVLEAVKKHGAALLAADAPLRRDRGLLEEAARNGAGAAMQGATSDMRADSALVLELAAIDAQAYQHASDDLKADRIFALTVAGRNGKALQYMSAKFKGDREIVEAAINQDPMAAQFAHTSRREDLGITLPWDAEARGQALIERVNALTSGEEESIVPQGAHQLALAGDEWKPTHSKLQKTVFFSAMSTMMGNMGQGNYTAANIYLDKIPALQRPEVDGVTIMWGAVGAIGMRWKAFASADMLNATPEALLSIGDASKILNITCTKMDPPEWYTTSYFDEYTRAAMISENPNAGWKPSETYGPLFADYESFGKGFSSQGGHASAKTPLGGWPGLWGEEAKTEEEESRERTVLPIEEGARVILSGLRSKNGTTGVLVGQCPDGKWKVRLDDHSGNALLKPEYLQVIMTAEEVNADAYAFIDEEAPTSDELRRLQAAERRQKLQEKVEKRKEAQRQMAAVTASSSALKARYISLDGGAPQEMTLIQVERCYQFALQLGSSGAASFQVLLDRSGNSCLHPAEQTDGCSGQEYGAEGPSSSFVCSGKKWTIGRHPDDKGSEGEQYEVRLTMKANGSADKVSWAKVQLE